MSLKFLVEFIVLLKFLCLSLALLQSLFIKTFEQCTYPPRQKQLLRRYCSPPFSVCLNQLEHYRAKRIVFTEQIIDTCTYLGIIYLLRPCSVGTPASTIMFTEFWNGISYACWYFAFHNLANTSKMIHKN